MISLAPIRIAWAPRALGAALAFILSLGAAADAMAEPVGHWKPVRVEGQPGAVTVTMVGAEGVSANRVAVFCTPYKRMAVSFARRPGLPANIPVTLTLSAEYGSVPLYGTTNGYGVLIVEGRGAEEAARLLATARQPALAAIADFAGLGPINVVGSTRAIARVSKACPPLS